MMAPVDPTAMKPTPAVYSTLLIALLALSLSGQSWSGHSRSEQAQALEFTSTDKQTILIEFFTSQGCSSCPPAEKWINRFSKQPDLWQRVIPIAYHVTYFDYLGWSDPYGNEAFTQLQRKYHQLGHTRSVYTPGFILNGKEWLGWWHDRALPTLQANTGILKATLQNQQLNVTYSKPASQQVLHVALLGFGLQTEIKKGENKNKTLTQEFVVLNQTQLPSDKGQWQLPMLTTEREVPKLGIALWVSEGIDPTPLQATGGWVTANKQ